MDYAGAVAFLEGLPAKKKWSLNPTRALCKMAGVQPEKLPCAIVTGTNGKGSVCAMLESVLRASGLETGFYSSPHLVKYNERFKISGKDIGDFEFCKLISFAKPLVEKYNSQALALGRETLSAFEVLTVCAFKLFEEKKLDFCVFEVGMGGRLDATNALSPELSIITNVGVEHADALGNSVEKISREKSGIMRKGKYAVTACAGSALLEVEKQAALMGAKPVSVGVLGSGSSVEYSLEKSTLHGNAISIQGGLGGQKLQTKLLGEFQAENAALAFCAAKILQKTKPILGITDKAMAVGIRGAKWPGRLEIICKKPLAMLDGSHNPAGAQALARSLGKLLAGKKLFLVLAVMKDKEVGEVVGALAPPAFKVLATRVAISRSASEKTIAKFAKKHCKRVKDFSTATSAFSAAINEAKKHSNSAVLAAGSLYLVGELKSQGVGKNCR